MSSPFLRVRTGPPTHGLAGWYVAAMAPTDPIPLSPDNNSNVAAVEKRMQFSTADLCRMTVNISSLRIVWRKEKTHFSFNCLVRPSWNCVQEEDKGGKHFAAVSPLWQVHFGHERQLISSKSLSQRFFSGAFYCAAPACGTHALLPTKEAVENCNQKDIF